MTQSTSQAEFSFPKKQHVKVTFDAGRLCSDGGLPLVRQLDDRLGITRSLASALVDWRRPVFVQHPLHDLVRARVYGILLGYEDCNDFASLRQDPLWKAACDRLREDVDLPSQPTFSRFENRASDGGIAAARATFLDRYLRRWKLRFRRPRRVVLDLDTTDDPTHGQQELSFFNGYYDTYCYQELLIYTDEGDLLWAGLLPGIGNVRHLAVQALAEVVDRLRERWPGLELAVRADNGFAGPALYDYCEDQNIEYAVNGGSHEVFQKKAAGWLREAQALFVAGEQQATALVFREFSHQADTWRSPRRVVVKAQRTPVGPDSRFIVTNSTRAPVEVYDFYAGRGQEENWIKDLKRALKSDRLSCTDFAANELRLLLFATAYELGHELRRRAPHPLRTAQLDTLRLRLLRIPALVKQTARRLWVRISEVYPWRSAWLVLARSVGAAVT